MKIAFVWWWTWWHIFPIKSLVEYLLENHRQYKKKSHTIIESNEKLIVCDNNKDSLWLLEIYWLWEKKSLEQKIAEELEVEFYPILSWKIRRYWTPISILQNFFDLFKLVIGFFQSLYFLYKNKIDVIFCKGWYVAIPVVLAGAILRKKIYVHESDTVPGLTNKIAAKFAKKVFWGFFLENNRQFNKIITGDLNKELQITKDDITDDWEKGDTLIDCDNNKDCQWLLKILRNSYEVLWWDKKVISVGQILSYDLIKWLSVIDNKIVCDWKVNILVIWWSQWARTIFDMLLKLAKKNLHKFEEKRRNIMIDEKYQFFIVLWTKNIGYKHNFTWFENVEVFEFVDQKKMWELLYVSDRSITRWWATSLAEQDLFWIKKIIIPLPFTAHNHQWWNGMWYKIFRWDILLEQDENLEKNLEKILSKNLKKKEKVNLKEIEKKINNTLQKIISFLYKN